MPITRIHKNGNYTVMSNYHLRDKNLSLKAKGLLSMVLTLPDNWEYSVSGLAAMCKEKETAVQSALKELKGSGYLIVKQIMPHGRVETGGSSTIQYEYNFYEKPHDSEQENPREAAENKEVSCVSRPRFSTPRSSTPRSSIPRSSVARKPMPILNTDILNTDKLNTEILNTDSQNDSLSFREPTPLEEKEKGIYFIDNNNVNMEKEKSDSCFPASEDMPTEDDTVCRDGIRLSHECLRRYPNWHVCGYFDSGEPYYLDAYGDKVNTDGCVTLAFD